MKYRFSDTKKLKRDDREFVRRRPATITWYVLGSIGIAFLVILGAGFNTKHLGELDFISLVVGVFGMLFLIAGFLLWRIHDLLMVGEFENAMFAGGANAGAEFCIIIRDTGDVAYISPGFHKFFKPDSSRISEGLGWLLSSMGMQEADKDGIIRAMQEKKRTQVAFEFTDLLGFVRKVVLMVEPIARPAGYSIVKAVRQKEAGELDPNVLETGGMSIITQFLDYVPWGGYITDQKGNFLYINRSLAELLSFKTPEILMQNHPQFHDIVFGSEGIGGEGFDASWDGELALKNVHRTPVKVHVRQILLIGADGMSHLKCGLVFLPEDKEDYAPPPPDPAATAANWHTLIDGSPLPMGMVDSRGIVMHSNAGFCVLAGKPEKEISGWSLLSHVDETSRPAVKALFYGPENTPGVPLKPVDVTLTGERQITVALYITAMQVEEGEAPHYLVYMIDVTEMKNLELRMVHSQKMQAVGQLAGGIAHDFNNLLTAMTGFCDLLLIRHPAGDPSFADIMQIKQNANRAANLVRQLLAFSRRQTLQPEIIDVTDTLAELSNLIRRLIGENIELDIQHARDLYLVKVDQGQFEQVIINLAVNARDAMSDGGTLTISTKPVTIGPENPVDPALIAADQDNPIADGEYTLIEVADTGHGIPKETLANIFEPFFSTKEVGSGTGLGLATVYGIVTQTGGHIYVQSEEGKGTTFCIFLKRASEEEVAASETVFAKDEKGETKDLTGAGNILLVEDEDPVRIFSARALRNKGYQVLEADCGEAALALMEERGDEVDLIVTDVVMPGITGPTMVEDILRRWPDMAVTFIPGYAEDAFLKTYGSERRFHFLPKPYTLKQLAGKVKDVMDEGD